MGGTSGQNLAEDNPVVENAQPIGETQEPAAAEVVPLADPAEAVSAAQDVIRSVYVARTAAAEAETAEIAHLETADDGRALRGAYLARLGEAESGTVGEDDGQAGDTLRRAYLAHASMAEAAEAVGAGRGKAAKARGAARRVARIKRVKSASAKTGKRTRSKAKGRPRAKTVVARRRRGGRR